jgi:predicted HicB family RNase H-like nuclease
MNNVKVFPIRLSKEFHQLLAISALKANKSIHTFIIEAIEKQVKDNGSN